MKKLLLFLTIFNTSATIYTLVDGSQATFNAANALVVAGDEIKFPLAGSSNTWTSLSTVSVPIKITGAGTNLTIITRNNGSSQVIDVTSSSGGKVEIANIQFVDGGTGSDNGVIKFSGIAQITNCFFNLFYQKSALSVYGWQSRVVVAYNGFYEHNTGVSIIGSTNTWDSGVSWGSTNYMVIMENNWFYNGTFARNGAYDAYNGATYIFRYNNVTNTFANHHGCDTGGYRSPHSCEIYNNLFVKQSGTIDYFMCSRGGSMLFYNNTMKGAANSLVKLQTFREDNRDCETVGALGGCSPWSWGDGTNPIDGNTGTAGYPYLDQVGRTGPTTFGVSSSTQVAELTRIYSNTNDTATVFSPISAYSSIQLARDYSTNTYSYTATPYPAPMLSSSSSSTTNCCFSFSGNFKFSGGFKF